MCLYMFALRPFLLPSLTFVFRPIPSLWLFFLGVHRHCIRQAWCCSRDLCWTAVMADESDHES